MPGLPGGRGNHLPGLQDIPLAPPTEEGEHADLEATAETFTEAVRTRERIPGEDKSEHTELDRPCRSRGHLPDEVSCIGERGLSEGQRRRSSAAAHGTTIMTTHGVPTATGTTLTTGTTTTVSVAPVLSSGMASGPLCSRTERVSAMKVQAMLLRRSTGRPKQ